jgi:hypothetical protein
MRSTWRVNPRVRCCSVNVISEPYKLHFSKRGGRYTPIVSIDFMRQRAAATGLCGGIDDAIFSGTPKTANFAATVTVWRFVQGQRCAFSATGALE